MGKIVSLCIARSHAILVEDGALGEENSKSESFIDGSDNFLLWVCDNFNY